MQLLRRVLLPLKMKHHCVCLEMNFCKVHGSAPLHIQGILKPDPPSGRGGHPVITLGGVGIPPALSHSLSLSHQWAEGGDSNILPGEHKCCLAVTALNPAQNCVD